MFCFVLLSLCAVGKLNSHYNITHGLCQFFMWLWLQHIATVQGYIIFYLLPHPSYLVISKHKLLTCFFTSYSCVWTSTWCARVENLTWWKICLRNLYSFTAHQRPLSSGHSHERRVKEKRAMHIPWLPSSAALWNLTWLQITLA
jgi:hypothetical protein